MYVDDEIDEYIKWLENYTVKGGGIVNTILKKLPTEMHLKLPKNVDSENVSNGSFNNTGKYSYCGPGTKVKKRIKEGYVGINKLDRACKEHDIAYSKNKDRKNRNIADDELARVANEIASDDNTPNYEKK